MGLLKKLGASLALTGVLLVGTGIYYTARVDANYSSHKGQEIRKKITEVCKEIEQQDDINRLNEINSLDRETLIKRVSESPELGKEYLFSMSRYKKFKEEKQAKMTELLQRGEKNYYQGIPEFLQEGRYIILTIMGTVPATIGVIMFLRDREKRKLGKSN